MRRQVAFWLGASGILVLLIGSPLFAAGGYVTVGGDLLFRIRVPSGGYTIQERTDRVYERLVTVIGEPRVNPEDITMRMTGPGYALFIRNQMIVTVDTGSAKANGTTRKTLANDWLRRLRRMVPQY